MLFREFFGLIDEMRVHGDIKTGKNIVAYKGNIWLLTNEPSLDTIKEILNSIGYDPDTYEGDNWNRIENQIDKIKDFHDFTSFLFENGRSDVLVGYINGRKLYIYNSGAFVQDPKSSILIKKVVNTLKLTSVSYEDDLDGTSAKVGKSKIIGEIPNVAYHGTSTKYISNIFKIGLRPNVSPSNYDDINHEGLIFFSTRFGEAFHHALTTSTKTKSKPIVIELTIPDKNLIIPDYDIDTQSGMTNYDNISQNLRDRQRKYTKFGSDNSFAMSKEHGVYGYNGSIHPNFIKNVYYSDNNETQSIKEMRKFTVKQFKRMIDLGYLDI
jgi:hypothetical protein